MIWWCQTHNIGDSAEPVPKLCWRSLAQRSPKPCHFVEALLIVKEDGEWPNAAKEAIAKEVDYELLESRVLALDILDALASVGDSQ